MKITDPKLLHELFDVEAERKLLIGYRFKGSLSSAAKVNGDLRHRKQSGPGKVRKRAAARRR